MTQLVAGVDSSTQSVKVVIRDAQTGALVRQGRAKHPDGTEVDPALWWSALQEAIADAGGLADVHAIAIGGQQHGMVLLNSDGEVIRPALLWNDTRSAKQNAAELGIDPDAIGVGGESAGANIAAGVAIKARDTGDIELKFQALIYPAVDVTCSSDSYKSFADGYGLTRKSMQWFWDQYLQKGSDRKNPYAVPVLAQSLTGVAPAIVITAEYDVLLDDG